MQHMQHMQNVHKNKSIKHSSNRLDRQTKLLLVVNGLFIAASALSGTFLNVYIWKASKDFIVLGWFNLIVHAAMALTFWIAGNVVKEGNKMIVLRLGIAVAAIFYGLVLLLGTHAIDYLWLLGVILGMAIGLFWLAFNVVYFEMTDADNRDRFNGLSGVIGSVVGMVVPWSSGFLISRMTGERGYRVIFILSFCVFIAGIGVSFLLRNRRTGGNYDWTMPIRIWHKPGNPWKKVTAALAAQGFRESVFGILIGVLVYIQTGSEFSLGNFALITSVIGFTSYYTTGRWLKRSWRRKGMLFGAVIMTVVIIPFFVSISFTTLLIFGIGTALALPLYSVPMTSAVFDWIGLDEESAQQRVEYVVMRELALNAGRIMGMIVFLSTLYISKAPLVMNVMMLVVGSSAVLSWFLIRNHLNPKQSSCGKT
jgi:YQGE family putative transporter